MLRKAILGLASGAVVLLLLVVASPREAEAIPAFARKYNVSCAVCHAPVPRLNETGQNFAANGFQFAVGEEPVNGVDTGDELLQLMDDLPLAVRFDGYAQVRSGGETPTADFLTPWAIKLLSGGQITPTVSYYMYFFLSERGEVAGLEDAYVQFSDLFGSPVNLMVGQFQVSDPLFKRELRLEFEDYQAYRVRVGDVRADLTYDRGLMAAYSPWDGGDLFVQVVNGQGIGAASEAKVYDTDNAKNLGARFSQGFGPLRLGAFAYYGREKADGVTSTMRVFGPDATLQVAPGLELNGQYLRRLDDRPFFGAIGPTDTRVDMALAELIWGPAGPGGRVFFTALYNHVSADEPIFTVRQGEEGLLERYRSAAFGGNYLLARNLRLTSEIQYDLDREAFRFVGGFVSAF